MRQQLTKRHWNMKPKDKEERMSGYKQTLSSSVLAKRLAKRLPEDEILPSTGSFPSCPGAASLGTYWKRS